MKYDHTFPSRSLAIRFSAYHKNVTSFQYIIQTMNQKLNIQNWGMKGGGGREGGGGGGRQNGEWRDSHE